MFALIFVSLSCIQAAFAWGNLGHYTVAYIAQNFVSDATREWTQNILDDSSDDYLAKFATYADTFKHLPGNSWSSYYHYIDAPDIVETLPLACAVDWPRDCGSHGCIVNAIANYTERVRNRETAFLPPSEVSLALKMLLHFFGDITQPLHTENYRKGATQLDVKWKGTAPSSGLHAVWDTEMPEEAHGEASLEHAAAWAADLTREIESGIYNVMKMSWVAGLDVSNTEDSAAWMARDSNWLVCSVVMPMGADALEGQELFPDYYNGVINTIDLQIAKGGYRLAKWLDALSPGSDDPESAEDIAVHSHADLR